MCLLRSFAIGGGNRFSHLRLGFMLLPSGATLPAPWNTGEEVVGPENFFYDPQSSDTIHKQEYIQHRQSKERSPVGHPPFISFPILPLSTKRQNELQVRRDQADFN